MQTSLKPTEIKYFQDFLNLAGGINQICLDFNLHQLTVARWGKFGFPDKYVIPFCEKYGATPFELRKLNKKIKAKLAKAD